MPTTNEKSDKKPRVERITTVDNPSSGGNFVFVAGLGLILLAGIAAVVFVAANRESNLGVAPEANLDHWHSAMLIHNCGIDLPITGTFEAPGGIHTHGDGLFPIHPYSPVAAGAEATLRNYFDAYGASLSDDEFVTGFADPIPATMSEAEGCAGEDAQLQLAIWDEPFNPDEEPTIITEDIADFRFSRGGQAITLALLPEGADIPRPPQERLGTLLQVGSGDVDNPVALPETDTGEETTEDGATEEGAEAEGSDTGADSSSVDADAEGSDTEGSDTGAADSDTGAAEESEG